MKVLYDSFDREFELPVTLIPPPFAIDLIPLSVFLVPVEVRPFLLDPLLSQALGCTTHAGVGDWETR